MQNNFLQTLNTKQLQAVEKIYGQVLVLAGPGSGKTHMLTARIANILKKTDCHPSNILCLTFTNAASAEMRKRLQGIIKSDSYFVKIATFHGFCEWVMEKFPAKFEKKKQSAQVADDLQKALIFEKVINSQKWKSFHSPFNDFQWQRDILGSISKLKRENLTPEKFRGILPAEKAKLEADDSNFYKRKTGNFAVGEMKPSAREKIDKTITKLEELADFWEKYETELRKNGLFDFDDQINWVVEKIDTDEGLKADLQEQFQFILVDEYQDTNNAQNKILWHLTDYEEPNIFAVGDDDQSIYRFQGASVANIAEFRKRFPNRTEITLEKNYRSTQNILDSAYASVATNTERANADKKLQSVNPQEFPEHKIQKIELNSQYYEMVFLIKKIREKLEEGIAPNQIAILVRKNKEIAELANFLPKFGIPVATEVFKNIFDNEFVHILILMLEIFVDPQNDEKFMNLLHSPFVKISREFLAQISVQAHSKKVGMLEFLLDLSAKNNSENSDHQNLAKFINFFTEARKNYFHCRPRLIAEKLAYESGLISYLVEKKDFDSFAAVNKLLSWISRQSSEDLKEIIKLIKLHQKLNIKIKPDKVPQDKNSVNILTAHNSKGREFEVVFISGLVDKNWGNPRNFDKISLPHLVSDQNFDENEEERRLFFVAITRAKKEIFLSFANTDFQGTSKSPAIFWHEIPENLAENLDSQEYEEEKSEILSMLIHSGEKLYLTQGEKTLFEETVNNFVWSASALNTYLECPRRFLFQNLYKFPQRSTPLGAFGVAIHEALERFFREKNFNQESLLYQYERALRGQNLAKKEFEKTLVHGQEILSQYFAEKLYNQDLESKLVKLEFDFHQFYPQINGIPIRGRADKIEFLDDSRNSAKIIDYKSGKYYYQKIKKGSNYWRQMVFYDLLARNSRGINWTVASTEIEFISPDANNKFITREIPITEEDRQIVIKELQEADKKIKKFEFPLVENPTNDENIEFWQNLGK